MKKLIISILILGAIGGAYYWFRSQSELSSAKALRLNITAYSVEGKVLALSADRVTILAGEVEKGASGNQFVSKEITVMVASTTRATKLAPGDHAIFSGTAPASPFAGGTLVATRIDVTSHDASTTLPKGAPVVR